MPYEPYFITAADLAARGAANIPAELQTDTNLIYNSPAALDFNSPGAQGFGVKRAGLAIPDSIMLLISPGCCGRNTAAISAADKFGERFAYLLLDENDIVTGKHLKKIPDAVAAFVKSRPTEPSCVMLCITCVDALLGTDMERVCRKASKAVNLPVLPSYMYALTRDSRRPPMTAVRKTVYSLLKPAKKNPAAVNLLGYFSPLQNSELFKILADLGIKQVNELAKAKNMAQYQKLSTANFNLVLNPEAREAADFMAKALNIPAIELKRLYHIDKIASQYKGLANILGAKVNDTDYYQQAQKTISQFIAKYPKLRLAIGSRLNANSFELALAMVSYGLTVDEIYAVPQKADFFYIKKLGMLSPSTKIFTNLSPSMVNFNPLNSQVNFALGADARYYYPDIRGISWNDEQQPFGYQAVIDLFNRMEEVL